MAKKTSTNAIKKIDDQIKDLEANSKVVDDTTTIKKSTTRKRTTRDKVVVVPAKKGTTSRKKTSSKNVRGDVLVTPTKRSTKKDTTKTIQSEALKNDFKNLKNEKETIIVPSEKKDLEAEVDRILGIEEEKPAFVPLDLRDDVPTVEVEKTEEVVVPEKKKKTTLKPIPKKEKTTSVPTEPQTIPEEKIFKEEDMIPDEKIVPPKEIHEVEQKVQDFAEKAREIEIKAPTSETSLDDVDVIKFEKKDSIPNKVYVSKKKGNLKKRPPVRKNAGVKKTTPPEVENLDKIEEYNIVEDFKKDISNRQNDFRRKRKGKGYVVDIPKKPYKELESDIRSLYDRVNDVVDDFETTKTPTKKPLFGKKKEVSGETTKKPFFSFKKKEKKEKVVVTKKKVVKKKPVEEVEILDSGRRERPSILDHISQKVLNFFLIVLFTIFMLMVIAFVAFVIYVSTF